MSHKFFEILDQEIKGKKKIPSFAIGDQVTVSVKIKEGEKERNQSYTGTVIARKGSGITETFTVRRISFGEGTERTFPVYSPNIINIKVDSSRHVRRAKLYYIRKRIGKTGRLKLKKQ